MAKSLGTLCKSSEISDKWLWIQCKNRIPLSPPLPLSAWGASRALRRVPDQSGLPGDADLEDEDLEVTPITTDATMDISPRRPSLRWTTFEDKLRQRREEVLESSIRAAERRSGPAASDTEAAERRKAS
jgi:hypothetical protein